MKTILLCWILCLSFSASSQHKGKYFSKGMKQFGNKEYNAALKSFSREYKHNKSSDVEFMIASCYFKKEDFSEAKYRYLKIIQHKPNGPEYTFSLVNLGSCYRSLKQLDSALYYYDQAILINDKEGEVFFNKAQLLYYDKGDFAAARSCYDSAISRKPDNWYYYQKRVEVNFASANFEEALADLKKVAEMNPKAPNEMNVAYCYSMLGKYELADSAFNVIYDEKDAFFLNNYGYNKFKLGNKALAIELIGKSLKINPKNPYAYRNLALIEIAENNLTKACEHLHKAADQDFKLHYGDEVQQLIEKYCKN